MGMRLPSQLLMLLVACLALAACQPSEAAAPEDLEVPENVVARVVYFQAEDCDLCEQITSDIIEPLQERCGVGLDVKTVDVGTTEGYEALVATESHLVGEPGRWDIPVIVVAEMAYVGDRAIREGLLPYLKCVFGAGGNAWPAVPALESFASQSVAPSADNPFGTLTGESLEACVDEEEGEVCESPTPIFALYLMSADCTDTCDRTRYDLTYLRGVYPQLSFETRPIEENRELADALAERAGVPADQWGQAPAVVFGDDYLVGEDLNLETLRERLDAYADTGAVAVWYALDLSE